MVASDGSQDPIRFEDFLNFVPNTDFVQKKFKFLSNHQKSQ